MELIKREKIKHLIPLAKLLCVLAALGSTLLCWSMIIVTAYFKICYWRDFVTPIIGAIIAVFFIKLRNKMIQKIETASI